MPSKSKGPASGKTATPSLEFQLAALVQRGMKQKGMNPTDLANATGISRATLYRLFRGDGNLTLKVSARVAWALGVRYRIRSPKGPAKAQPKPSKSPKSSPHPRRARK